MSLTATAPGKVFLFGEYAVLLGAPALVAAAPPLAEARLTTTSGATRRVSLPDRVAEQVARGLARRGAMPPRSRVVVSTEGFVGPGGRTLGLGSSAAVAAASAKLLVAAAGLDPDEQWVLDAAMAGHSEHQGGIGSGADVAASFTGGVIGFVMARPPNPLAMPAGLHVEILSVGPGGVSTRDMITRVMNRTPVALEAIGELSERAIDATRRADAARLVDLAREAFEAMVRLSHEAGVEVVTAAERRLAAALEGTRVAYKPSGAGGGEIGLLLSTDPGAMEEALTLAQSRGMSPLPVATLGVPGARVMG